MGLDIPTVGDQGELPSSLPSWFIADVPHNLDTLQIIAPYAFAMALVGPLGSLMTAKLVDDITDTHSEKTREGWGQGVATIVARIPMAALVAVMIMVSVGTMDWHSVHPRTLRRIPLSATTIMLTTVS